MKKATSKILMAAMSLVVAIGIATGTTFAWFTTNRTVNVSTVQATVTTGTDGLYVAIKTGPGETDYTKFKSSIEAADLNTALYGKASPSADDFKTILLDALTSADGEALTDEKGVAAPEFVAGATTPNKYIQFTLKFRTTVAQDIYLAKGVKVGDGTKDSEIITNGNATVANQVLAWANVDASVYGKSLTAGDRIEARAANAARVSFVSGSNKNIWAPNEVEGKGFWKSNLADDYKSYFLGNKTADEIAATPSAVTAPTATLKMLSDEDAQKQPAVIGDATKIATTAKTANNAYEAEVTVRIWIEGNDGDCFNSIFGDKFDVNLYFNSVRAA